MTNLHQKITLAISDIKWLLNTKNINGDLINLKNLRFTVESKYSITPWREATLITDKIISFFGDRSITITDATANVGGNTIDFYNNGINSVNSVEIDTQTCKILKNNLRVYGYKTDSIYNHDYTNICMKLKQDCIFFDPPWGGPDYIKQDKIDLFLGEINIVDTIYELFLHNKARLIVLKAPKNFNIENLETKLQDFNITKQEIYRGKDKKHSYNVFYISIFS
jgi:trimethylguanosine synthase